eukprot:10115054-Ditylum_brightwellii.AAC.1
MAHSSSEGIGCAPYQAHPLKGRSAIRTLNRSWSLRVDYPNPRHCAPRGTLWPYCGLDILQTAFTKSSRAISAPHA